MQTQVFCYLRVCVYFVGLIFCLKFYISVKSYGICLSLPDIVHSYKWKPIVYALLCLVSFTQHNSFDIHPCYYMCINSPLLPCWWLFHCMNTPQSIHPFTHSWTFELFLVLGYYKVAANIPEKSLCMDICFYCCNVNTKIKMAGSYGACVFHFLRNCKTFQRGCMFYLLNDSVREIQVLRILVCPCYGQAFSL